MVKIIKNPDHTKYVETCMKCNCEFIFDKSYINYFPKKTWEADLLDAGTIDCPYCGYNWHVRIFTLKEYEEDEQ